MTSDARRGSKVILVVGVATLAFVLTAIGVMPRTVLAAAPTPNFSLSCNGTAIAAWQNASVTSVTFVWTDGGATSPSTATGLHGHHGFGFATAPISAEHVTATFYLQHGNNPAEQVASLESNCPGVSS
jgi:hypothetical protein